MAKSSSPAAMAPAPPPAAISFSQYAVTIRETSAVPAIHTHFDFQNRSDKPVQITRVKPSCGCVSSRIAGFKLTSTKEERNKKTYGPNERGTIELTLPTANESPGRHQYTISVTWNDGVEHQTDLKFNVELPAKSVRLEPKELHFYQYGERLSRTVRVIDERNKVLDVVDVRLQYYQGEGKSRPEVPGEVAEASVLPSEITPDGKRATPIQVEVSADVPPATNIVHLVVTTSDPDFKTLMVPIWIQPRKPAAPVEQSSVPPVPGL